MTTTSKKIRLKIDGVEVEAKPGQMVIEAARDAGIYIPYLCWHPIMKPYGACRMCVVEVSNVRGQPASCHTPVADGMEIKTNTPVLEDIRRDVLALTLVNHPHGCLTCWRTEHCGPKDVCLRNVSVTDRCVVCPQNERCELQDVTYYTKVAEVPLPYQYRNIPLDTRNPFIDHDMNLCIVCGKCVRACNEIEGVDAIIFEERGNRTVVATSQGGTLAESGCTFCGLCVDVCPVGAITEKDSKWAGRADDVVTSACSHCSVGCSLNLNVKKDKLIRVTHDIEGEGNHGQECVQGKFGYKWVYSKDRVLAPQVRRDGKLEETTWPEAVSLIAQRLATYRTDEIAVFGSPKATNEDSFVLQKFARAALGVSNVDFIDPLMRAPALAGLERAFGSTAATGTLAEMSASRLILVVDADLTFEHPVAALQIKEAVRRGAKLVVLDPRDTELGMLATEKLACAPDTEVAVLGGIMRALLDAGGEDKAFIRQRCDTLDELAASLQSFDLAPVAKLSGIPAERMVQVARLLATHTPAAFVFGGSLAGVDDSLGSALANLAMLTGNVGKPGAGVFPMRGENNSQGAEDMGVSPEKLSGGQPVGAAGAWLRHREMWGSKLSQTPGLTGPAMLEAMRQRKIKAAIFLGENQVLPDASGKLALALQAAEFVVSHQALPSVLSQHAHVVLPAASFAERDGTTTSVERRVQRVRQAVKPQGQARSAWQAIAAIAQQMGATGFDYTNASQIMDEIATLTPAYAGISYDRLEAGSVQWPCPDAEHPGSSNLYASQFLRGRGLFQAMAPPVAASAKDGLTAFVAVAREVKGIVELGSIAVAEVASADAAKLGIRTGETIRVIAPMGEIAAKARVNGRAALGCVLLTLPHYSVIMDVFNKATPGQLALFTRANKRYSVQLRKA